MATIVRYGYSQKLWLMCGNNAVHHFHNSKIDAWTNVALRKNFPLAGETVFTVKIVFFFYTERERKRKFHIALPDATSSHFHQTNFFVILNACKHKQTKPCFTITKNMCIDVIYLKKKEQNQMFVSVFFVCDFECSCVQYMHTHLIVIVY